MNELRGKIISVFGSMKKFASALGWSSRRVYDIVNGRQEPTASDIDAMCSALHVEIPGEMRKLFFAR